MRYWRERSGPWPAPLARARGGMLLVDLHGAGTGLGRSLANEGSTPTTSSRAGPISSVENTTAIRSGDGRCGRPRATIRRLALRPGGGSVHRSPNSTIWVPVASHSAAWTGGTVDGMPRNDPRPAAYEGERSGDETDLSERLSTRWSSGRSGGNSGRGYHFQEAVGAWILAGLVTSSIEGSSGVTPEGLEDLSVEGLRPLHVQVKSRQARLGKFPVGVACGHIVDAMLNHEERREPGAALVVVLERGIEEVGTSRRLHASISEAFAEEPSFLRKLSEVAKRRDIDAHRLAELMSATSVVGLSWQDVEDATRAELERVTSQTPSAYDLIGRHLRTLIADAADENASRSYEQRRTIERTEAAVVIDEVVAQLDVDALEQAVRQGTCEPLRYPQVSSTDERFYEGVSTQPEHVVSGLVVPRPDLVDSVVAGLEQDSAVLVTGPSGIGKSAVAWTIPLVMPGILWFRVLRLDGGDIAPLVRLVRAYRASPAAPVAFVVDGAGMQNLSEWAALRRAVSRLPGVKLLGTARSEDLEALGDLAETITVEVRLDEAGAEAIYDGLVRRGATTAQHWREAYEQSAQLTLEFTHLLTQGSRMREVLDDQVRRRIHEQRVLELQLLGAASVAARWSAYLRSQDLYQLCNADPGEIRLALSRLYNEHLLVERDGRIEGLHQLRSTQLVESVHAQPPPTLEETASLVLPYIPAETLHRFVATMLRDHLELSAVVERVGSREAGRGTDRLVGYVHGLRICDFYNLALRWLPVAADHGVPLSAQPLLFAFTSLGVSFNDFFPEELRSAQAALQGIQPPTDLVSGLMSRIGPSEVAAQALALDDLFDAGLLLSVVADQSEDVTTAILEQLAGESTLTEAVRAAELDELASFAANARRLSIDLAICVLNLAGGEKAMLSRLVEEVPWLTAVEIRRDSDAFIGYARFLHVAESVTGDATKQAHRIGRYLLRLFPSIERVDVQALLPGGMAISNGSITLGVSNLSRDADPTPSEVAWNQARSRVALTLISQSDTMRLSNAVPLFGEAASILQELGYALAAKRPIRDEVLFAERLKSLHLAATKLGPSSSAVQLADTTAARGAPAISIDPVSSLVSAVTGNVVPRILRAERYDILAGYLRDGLVGETLPEVESERWYLLGIDGPPEPLLELRSALADLQAVLTELGDEDGDNAKMTRSARAGRSGTPGLRRAADTARKAQRRRDRQSALGLISALRDRGLTCNFVNSRQQKLLSEVVTAIELDAVLNWYPALIAAKSALDGQELQTRSVILVPHRNGRPIPKLTRCCGHTVYEVAFPEWAFVTPEPHPDFAVRALESAVEGIKIVSTVSHLPLDQRDNPIVEETVNEAAGRIAEAQGELKGLPDDLTIVMLRALVGQWAERAISEIDSPTPPGRSIVVELTDARTLGDQTSPAAQLAGAVLLAHEWQIDPDAADSYVQAAMK